MTYEELERKHAKRLEELFAKCNNDPQRLREKFLEFKTLYQEKGLNKEDQAKAVQKVIGDLNNDFKDELLDLLKLDTEQTKEKTNLLVVTKALEAAKSFTNKERQRKFERD